MWKINGLLEYTLIIYRCKRKQLHCLGISYFLCRFSICILSLLHYKQKHFEKCLNLDIWFFLHLHKEYSLPSRCAWNIFFRWFLLFHKDSTCAWNRRIISYSNSMVPYTSVHWMPLVLHRFLSQTNFVFHASVNCNVSENTLKRANLRHSTKSKWHNS